MYMLRLSFCHFSLSGETVAHLLKGFHFVTKLTLEVFLGLEGGYLELQMVWLGVTTLGTRHGHSFEHIKREVLLGPYCR